MWQKVVAYVHSRAARTGNLLKNILPCFALKVGPDDFLSHHCRLLLIYNTTLKNSVNYYKDSMALYKWVQLLKGI